MPKGEYYDDNMFAYMDMTVGIDLTNYQNTYLTYKILYDTEYGYDEFQRWESNDGINWEPKEIYSGNSSGWEDVIIPILSSGTYYVSFVFESDENYSSDYGGVYIDDIEITGDPIAQPMPNLTYDYDFSLDGPIIISQVPNTSESDLTLYGGITTYIDWGITNQGDAASGPFTVNLDIDGVTKKSWAINNIDPLFNDYKLDYACILSTGSHDIELYIDPLNQVDESDEFDNWYWKNKYWLASEISFSGTVNHLDLNTATGLQIKSSNNIWIQLMDKNTPTDRILAETTTNSDGNFFFDNISNVDTDGTNLDLYIKLLAYNDAAFATSELTGNVIVDNSPVYNNIPPGNYDTTITVNSQVNDYFFVINTIKEAKTKWLQLRSQNPVTRTQVIISSNGIGTKNGNGAIWIENSDNDLLGYPDTYDKDIIYHEYIHRIQDIYGFFDSNGGLYNNWSDTIGLMLASHEGLAEVLPVIFRDDGSSLYHDYFSNFSQNNFFDMENGEYGTDGIVDASVNNFGEEVIGSVAGILWDIYDDIDDDYSTYGSSAYPNLSNPDGIGDTLTDGIDNILSTLLDKNVNGHHPDNISEFWNAWFQSPSFDHRQAMKDIWYEHGILISDSCCIGIRGNVNGDPQDIINVSDLVYLVHFMFQGGAAPLCFEEANVDGSGSINMSDLVYLVEFEFNYGPAPLLCP